MQFFPLILVAIIAITIGVIVREVQIQNFDIRDLAKTKEEKAAASKQKSAAQQAADSAIRQRERSTRGGCDGAGCLASEISNTYKEGSDALTTLQKQAAGGSSAAKNTLAVLEMTELAGGKKSLSDAKDAVQYCVDHSGKNCDTSAGMTEFMKTVNSDLAANYEKIKDQPQTTILKGTDACGSASEDEGYRTCIKNPPVQLTIVTDPATGIKTQTIIGYTTGGDVKELFNLTQSTDKDGIIVTTLNGNNLSASYTYQPRTDASTGEAGKTVVLYGTEACGGPDESEAKRACMRNPPISLTLTTNPDGSQIQTIVGYTIIGGIPTKDTYTLTTTINAKGYIVNSDLGGKDVTGKSSSGGPMAAAAPGAIVTPAPTTAPAATPAPSGVNQSADQTTAQTITAVNGMISAYNECAKTGGANCELVAQNSLKTQTYSVDIQAAALTQFSQALESQKISAARITKARDTLFASYTDCVNKAGTNCEALAQNSIDAQNLTPEEKAAALTQLSQSIGQQKLQTSAASEAVKGTKLYQAYEKYLTENKNISYEEYINLNKEAFNRMSSTYALTGEEEKNYAAFLRGDFVPLDNAAAYDKSPLITRAGFAIARFIDPIGKQAFGTSQQIAQNRAQGIYSALTVQQQQEYQKNIAETHDYQIWHSLPENSRRGADQYILYQLTEGIKNENSLITAGNIRTDNTAQIYDQIMRGQLNAVSAAKALQGNTLQRIAVSTFNIADALTGGAASRTFVKNPSPQLETDQSVAAAKIWETGLKNQLPVIKESNPETYNEITKKLADPVQEKKIIENYAAGIFLKDHANSGNIAGVNQLYAFDPTWFESAALKGTVDLVAVKSQVEKDVQPTLQVIRVPSGKTGQQIEAENQAARTHAAEIVLDAYLTNLNADPAAIQKLNSELAANRPDLKESQYDAFRRTELKAMVLNTNNNSNDLTLLYQINNKAPTIDQILNGSRSYTADLSAVADAKKITWAGLPAGQMAFALNRFENGLLGVGQVLRNNATASWNSSKCQTALDSSVCSQAAWDGIRGGGMQIAKPVITIVSTVIPGGALVRSGASAITMPVIMDVGSAMLGAQFTADGIGQTLNTCSFNEGMDKKACLTSAGMTAFAAASSIPGFRGIGKMYETAGIAGAKTSVEALIASGAERAAIDNATKVLVTRTAAAQIANTTTYARILANPWTQRATSGLGALVFGSQAIDVCKEGLTASCAVTTGFAVVSGARVLVNPAIAQDVQSAVGKAIHTADQAVNLGLVAESCSGANKSAGQCTTALFMASLAFRTPGAGGQEQQQINEVPRQTMENALSDIAKIRGANVGDAVQLSNGEKIIIKDAAFRQEQIKNLSTVVSEGSVSLGLQQARLNDALKKVSGTSNSLLPSEKALVEAQKLWETAGKGTALEQDQAQQALIRAKSAVDSERALLQPPRNVFQRISDRIAPSTAVVEYQTARDAFDALRGKDITDPAYAAKYADLAAKRTALERSSFNSVQKAYAAQSDEAKKTVDDLTIQAKDLQTKILAATDPAAKAALQKQLDGVVANIETGNQKVAALSLKVDASGGIRNTIDIALGRDNAVLSRVEAQVAISTGTVTPAADNTKPPTVIDRIASLLRVERSAPQPFDEIVKIAKDSPKPFEADARAKTTVESDVKFKEGQQKSIDSLKKQFDAKTITQQEYNDRLATIENSKTEALRLIVPSGASSKARGQIEAFNKMLDRFEVTKGFHINEQQLTLLLREEPLLQLQAGGGKSTVIGPILSAMDRMSVVSLPTSADANSYVNGVRSDIAFYKGENIEVYYFDSQKGFLEIDPTKPFDRNTATIVDPAKVRARMEEVARDPAKIGIKVITQSSDNAWGNIQGKNGVNPSSVAMYDLVLGKYVKLSTLIVDEVGAVSGGHFSVSRGSAQKISALTNSKDLSGLQDAGRLLQASTDVRGSPELSAFRAKVISQIQAGQTADSLFFSYKDGAYSVSKPYPKDMAVVGRSYSELIKQTLDHTSPGPEVKARLESLRDRLIRSPSDDSLRLEFENLLKDQSFSTDADSLAVADLAYRTSDLQARWEVLSKVPNNNFGLEEIIGPNGTKSGQGEMVLRESGGTTGQTYSDVQHRIALQEEGFEMWKATGRTNNGLDVIGSKDLTVTPDSDQMSNKDIFRQKIAVGKFKGYDATPDTASVGLDAAATGRSERPPDPKFIMQAGDTDSLIRKASSDPVWRAETAGKTKGVVIADNGVDNQRTTKDFIQENKDINMVVRTKYVTDPNGAERTEYYIERVIRDTNGNVIDRQVISRPATQEAWGTEAQKILSDYNAGNVGKGPENVAIIYEGRTRAVDFPVDVYSSNNKNISWTVIASDRQTMEDITQSWKRNRVPARAAELLSKGWSQEQIDKASEYALWVRNEDGVPVTGKIIDHYQAVLDSSLRSLRYEQTIQDISQSQSKSLTSLRDTLLSKYPSRADQIQNDFKGLIDQAVRAERARAMEIQTKPLTGDEIAREVYARGKESFDTLTIQLDAIQTRYGLSSGDFNGMKATLGLNTPYPTQEEFFAMYNRKAEAIPTNKNPIGPSEVAMSWAQTNDPSTLPRAAWNNKSSADTTIAKEQAQASVAKINQPAETQRNVAAPDISTPAARDAAIAKAKLPASTPVDRVVGLVAIDAKLAAARANLTAADATDRTKKDGARNLGIPEIILSVPANPAASPGWATGFDAEAKAAELKVSSQNNVYLLTKMIIDAAAPGIRDYSGREGAIAKAKAAAFQAYGLTDVTSLQNNIVALTGDRDTALITVKKDIVDELTKSGYVVDLTTPIVSTLATIQAELVQTLSSDPGADTTPILAQAETALENYKETLTDDEQAAVNTTSKDIATNLSGPLILAWRGTSGPTIGTFFASFRTKIASVKIGNIKINNPFTRLTADEIQTNMKKWYWRTDRGGAFFNSTPRDLTRVWFMRQAISAFINPLILYDMGRVFLTRGGVWMYLLQHPAQTPSPTTPTVATTEAPSVGEHVKVRFTPILRQPFDVDAVVTRVADRDTIYVTYTLGGKVTNSIVGIKQITRNAIPAADLAPSLAPTAAPAAPEVIVPAEVPVEPAAVLTGPEATAPVIEESPVTPPEALSEPQPTDAVIQSAITEREQLILLSGQYADTQTRVNTLISLLADAETALEAAQQTKLDADSLVKQKQAADKRIVDLTGQRKNMQTQLTQLQSKLQSLNTQISQLEKTIASVQPAITPQQQQARAQKVLTDLIRLIDERIDRMLRETALNIGKKSNMTESDTRKNLVDSIRRAYNSAQIYDSALQTLMRAAAFANDPQGAAVYARDIANTLSDTWFINRHMALSRVNISVKTDTTRERNITAVGDVHGDWNQLVRLLSGQVTDEKGKSTKRLLDERGNWIGGPTDQLVLTGDLFDRAPDGVNSAQTAEKIMKLQQQAGYLPDGTTPRVKVLLGNHDVNALFLYWSLVDLIRQYPGKPLQELAESVRHIGVKPSMAANDLVSLYNNPNLRSWLESLDAMTLVSGSLYMHSDNDGYLEYGTTVPEVNNAIRSVVQNRQGVDALYHLMSVLTGHRIGGGTELTPDKVTTLLDTYRATHIVHGHTQFGIPVDSRVTNIDGGLSERYAKSKNLGPNRGRFATQQVKGGQTVTVSVANNLPAVSLPTLNIRPLSGTLLQFAQQQTVQSQQTDKLQQLQTTYDSINAQIERMGNDITSLDNDLQQAQSERNSLTGQIVKIPNTEKDIAAANAAVEARKLDLEREKTLLAKAQELLNAQRKTSDFLAKLRKNGLTIPDLVITQEGIGDLSGLGRTMGDILVESIIRHDFGNEKGIVRFRKIIKDITPASGFIGKVIEAGSVRDQMQMALNESSQLIRDRAERTNLIAQIKKNVPADVVLSDDPENLSLPELRDFVASIKVTPAPAETVQSTLPIAPVVALDEETGPKKAQPVVGERKPGEWHIGDIVEFEVGFPPKTVRGLITGFQYSTLVQVNVPVVDRINPQTNQPIGNPFPQVELINGIARLITVNPASAPGSQSTKVTLRTDWNANNANIQKIEAEIQRRTKVLDDQIQKSRAAREKRVTSRNGILTTISHDLFNLWITLKGSPRKSLLGTILGTNAEDTARYLLSDSPDITGDLNLARRLFTYYKGFLKSLDTSQDIKFIVQQVPEAAPQNSIGVNQREIIQALYERLGSLNPKEYTDDDLFVATAGIVSSLRAIQTQFGSLDMYRTFFKDTLTLRDYYMEQTTGWSGIHSDYTVILPVLRKEFTSGLVKNYHDQPLASPPGGYFASDSEGILISTNTLFNYDLIRKIIIHELTHTSQEEIAQYDRGPNGTFQEAVTEGVAEAIIKLPSKYDIDYTVAAKQYERARDLLIQAGIPAKTVWRSFFVTSLSSNLDGYNHAFTTSGEYAAIGMRTLFEDTFGLGTFDTFISGERERIGRYTDAWMYNPEEFTNIAEEEKTAVEDAKTYDAYEIVMLRHAAINRRILEIKAALQDSGDNSAHYIVTDPVSGEDISQNPLRQYQVAFEDANQKRTIDQGKAFPYTQAWWEAYRQELTFDKTNAAAMAARAKAELDQQKNDANTPLDFGPSIQTGATPVQQAIPAAAPAQTVSAEGSILRSQIQAGQIRYMGILPDGSLGVVDTQSQLTTPLVTLNFEKALDRGGISDYTTTHLRIQSTDSTGKVQFDGNILQPGTNIIPSDGEAISIDGQSVTFNVKDADTFIIQISVNQKSSSGPSTKARIAKTPNPGAGITVRSLLQDIRIGINDPASPFYIFDANWLMPQVDSWLARIDAQPDSVLPEIQKFNVFIASIQVIGKSPNSLQTLFERYISYIDLINSASTADNNSFTPEDVSRTGTALMAVFSEGHMDQAHLLSVLEAAVNAQTPDARATDFKDFLRRITARSWSGTNNKINVSTSIARTQTRVALEELNKRVFAAQVATGLILTGLQNTGPASAKIKPSSQALYAFNQDFVRAMEATDAIGKTMKNLWNRIVTFFQRRQTPQQVRTQVSDIDQKIITAGSGTNILSLYEQEDRLLTQDYYAASPGYEEILQADSHFTGYRAAKDQGISGDVFEPIPVTGLPTVQATDILRAGGVLKKFLAAPVIEDSYPDTTQGAFDRRDWKEKVRADLKMQRGSTTAADWFIWYQANKLAAGELAKVLMVFRSTPELFSADLFVQAKSLTDSTFTITNPDAPVNDRVTLYDTMSHADKLAVVAQITDLATQGIAQIRTSASKVQTTSSSQVPAPQPPAVSQEQAINPEYIALQKLIADAKDPNVSIETLLTEMRTYVADIKSLDTINRSPFLTGFGGRWGDDSVFFLALLSRIVAAPDFSNDNVRLTGPDDPRVVNFPTTIIGYLKKGNVDAFYNFPNDQRWIQFWEIMRQYEGKMKDPALLDLPENAPALKETYPGEPLSERLRSYYTVIDSQISGLYRYENAQARDVSLQHTLVSSGQWLGHGTYSPTLEKMIQNGATIKSPNHVLNSGGNYTDMGSYRGSTSNDTSAIFFSHWKGTDEFTGTWSTGSYAMTDAPIPKTPDNVALGAGGAAVFTDVAILYPVDTLVANGLTIGSRQLNYTFASGEFFVTKSPDVFANNNLTPDERSSMANSDQTELSLRDAYLRLYDQQTYTRMVTMLLANGFTNDWINEHVYVGQRADDDAFRQWLETRNYRRISMPQYRPVQAVGFSNYLWVPEQQIQPENQTETQVTQLTATVEEFYADMLTKVNWTQEGTARIAVEKIVTEAFMREYQDRAPPFTADQQTSIISAVVENILNKQTTSAQKTTGVLQYIKKIPAMLFNASSVITSIALTYLQTGKSRLDSPVGQAMHQYAAGLPSIIYDHMGNANIPFIFIGVLMPFISIVLEYLGNMVLLLIKASGRNITSLRYYLSKLFEKLPLVMAGIFTLINIDVETFQIISRFIIHRPGGTADLLDIPAGLIGIYGGYLLYTYSNKTIGNTVRSTINKWFGGPVSKPIQASANYEAKSRRISIRKIISKFQAIDNRVRIGAVLSVIVASIYTGIVVLLRTVIVANSAQSAVLFDRIMIGVGLLGIATFVPKISNVPKKILVKTIELSFTIFDKAQTGIIKGMKGILSGSITVISYIAKAINKLFTDILGINRLIEDIGLGDAGFTLWIVAINMFMIYEANRGSQARFSNIASSLGNTSYWYQHIGDVWETMGMFAIFRLFVIPLVNRFIMPLSARSKIYLSAISSFLTIAYLELTGSSGVTDVQDLFGIIVGTGFTVGLWELIRLFQRKKLLIEKGKNAWRRIKSTVQSPAI